MLQIGAQFVRKCLSLLIPDIQRGARSVLEPDPMTAIATIEQLDSNAISCAWRTLPAEKGKRTKSLLKIHRTSTKNRRSYRQRLNNENDQECVITVTAPVDVLVETTMAVSGRWLSSANARARRRAWMDASW
jgi:hypothetical protein